MKTEENLYIKILEFGYSKPEGFTIDELNKALKLKDWEKSIIDKYFSISVSNGMYKGKEIGVAPVEDTMFFRLTTGENQKFTLSYNACFNYIDYLEFKEARKSSKQAIWTAIFSILLTLIATTIQIISIQDVKISNFPDTQKVEVQNQSLKSEVTNFPKIQPVWVNN